jgi:hypothetical protein
MTPPPQLFVNANCLAINQASAMTHQSAVP